MRNVGLDEIFTNTPIMKVGRTTVPYTDPDSAEEATVRRVWREGVRNISFVSPKWASLLAPQEDDMVKWAGVVKAEMEEQPIRNPGGPGKIHVDMIIPELIKIQSATGTTQYTTFTVNSMTWAASTSGTAQYILGSATAGQFWQGITTDGSMTSIVIAKDGIVTLGVAPNFDQMRLVSDADAQYPPWSMPPTYQLPIEDGKAIYLCPTPGMIAGLNDMGITLSVMPRITGTTTTFGIAGLAFCQYNQWTALTTRA